MSRRRRTVEHFARLAAIAPGHALQILIQSGIRVPKVTAVVPKSKLRQALITLGLSKPKATLAPTKPTHDKTRIQERRERRQQRRASAESEQAQRKHDKAIRLATQKRNDLIGKEQSLVFLGANDVETIHWVLVKDFSTGKDPIIPAGVTDTHLLHSALTRCRTSLGHEDKYPTAPMAAAALIHSLIHDHPFHNGNKRTALVSMLTFFDKNGWTFLADEDELYNYFLRVGAHEILDSPAPPSSVADGEVAAISRWLSQHIKRTEQRHKPMQFRQLRRILSGYDCKLFCGSTGSKMNIVRNGLKIQINYHGEGRTVALDTIADVRRALELDEVHGYDTDMFYNSEDRLPAFIAKYRKALDRLAKV